MEATKRFLRILSSLPKVYYKLPAPATITEDETRERALNCDAVRRQLDGRRVARVVYVPGRLVNVVTEVVDG